MEPAIIASFVVCVMAGCSAMGGWVAYTKHRRPHEGVLLGLLLGPLGVLIEWRCPTIQRPLVDQNAWNSLRSMMDYQASGRESGRRRGPAN